MDLSYVDIDRNVDVCAEQSDETKSEIQQKIDDADKVIVILGEDTHTCKWIEWETNYAFEQHKPIITIKTQSKFSVPEYLYGKTNMILTSFYYDQIVDAIEGD